MHIRAEKKLSRLLITAALLAPLALPVQAEFVERKIETPNIAPTVLITAPHNLITEEVIVRDLRGPSSVSDITLTVNDNGELVIRNNTVRHFSDISMLINGTGITINQVIRPRTSLILALPNTELSASTALIHLEPYGAYSPNASEFNSSVEKDIWVDVYADIQRNMMKFYARAETYDDYRNFFWSERDETLSSSLGKWHRTATYDIPKSFRKAHKAAGLAGGGWLGLAGYTLDRSFTVTDYTYTSHYGTFSHEYGHTMGFSHGSGMAYGWDDPVRAEMKILIENGTVNRVTNGDEPTRHDVEFFTYFDKDTGLSFYQKPGAKFSGIDWVRVVYDDEHITLSEETIADNKISFDINNINTGTVYFNRDRVLFNTRLNQQEYMANHVYQVKDNDTLSLGLTSIFIPEIGEDVDSGIVIDPTTGATGPAQITHERGADPTAFSFPVTSQTGETVTIHATGRTYYPGCSWKQLENAAGCTRQQSSDINLQVFINKEDNQHLANGKYTGTVPLHQVSYLDNSNQVIHQVPVDIAIFEDSTHTQFAAEQAQHEQNRLDALYTLPGLEGSMVGNATPTDALTLSINGEDKTLCYLQDAKKDLSTIPLLGFVEGDVCTIGELNSYNGVQGYSSDSFLTFNKYTMSQTGDALEITFPGYSYTARICYLEDEPWTGVGIWSGSRCTAHMTASNGNAWRMKTGVKFASQQRDTLAQLPENEGWVMPSADVTPLIVNFDQGEHAVCRMSILGVQLLGYVDGAECTIGANNIWKGVQGFSSYQFQVVDAKAKTKIESVKVTVGPSNWFTEPLDVDLCYRAETSVAGIGFSTYGQQCMQHDRGVKTSTGSNWYFGYNSNSQKVTWDYALTTNDIWLAPAPNQLSVKFATSQGEKSVCRFASNDKAHFGLVNENNACEIGAGRSLNGTDNFASADYQVIAANIATPGEPITFTHDNSKQVQLCSRGDYIGYSFNGSRCEQVEMLASNGNRWLYSRGNQMMPYTYQFPQDNGWVLPNQAVNTYKANTALGELEVCRTHFNNRTVMGFVDNNQCKINDDTKIEESLGFSNNYYQVIDTTLGTSAEPVMVTWEDGVSREICYRPDAQWMGVGYRGNSGDRYVNRCMSSLTTESGVNYKFSYGNTMITFP